MTERKFTPPTEFPAEYVDGEGNKAVILGRGPCEEVPFIGYDAIGDPQCWTKFGKYYIGSNTPHDLHDITKRISTWHNVYSDWLSPQCSSRSDADEISHRPTHAGRLCVYRIERDPDGGNPEIFVEDV